MADDSRSRKDSSRSSRTANTTKGNKKTGIGADRTSDMAWRVNDALAAQEDSKEKTFRVGGTPDLGERLAMEQAENAPDTGAGVKIVEKDGVRSVVSTAASPKEVEEASDNGKTYSDPRIVPRDTNAPDAGLTPSGVRVAE